MSDDIKFNGASHNDIYFNGHYHIAAYLGDKLVWKKNQDIDENNSNGKIVITGTLGSKEIIPTFQFKAYCIDTSNNKTDNIVVTMPLASQSGVERIYYLFKYYDSNNSPSSYYPGLNTWHLAVCFTLNLEVLKNKLKQYLSKDYHVKECGFVNSSLNTFIGYSGTTGPKTYLTDSITDSVLGIIPTSENYMGKETINGYTYSLVPVASDIGAEIINVSRESDHVIDFSYATSLEGRTELMQRIINNCDLVFP